MMNAMDYESNMAIPDDHNDHKTRAPNFASAHHQHNPHYHDPSQSNLGVHPDAATPPGRVNHTYRDYSRQGQDGNMKGKRASSNFPAKLHQILSNPEYSHIISWMPHGRAWKILNKDLLVEQVIPKYFVQSKYESFTRQLSGWGFKRLHQSGPDFRAYYHECFLRGLPHLTQLMKRVETNLGKMLPHVEGEPNFYDIDTKYPLPQECNSAASKGAVSSCPPPHTGLPHAWDHVAPLSAGPPPPPPQSGYYYDHGPPPPPPSHDQKYPSYHDYTPSYPGMYYDNPYDPYAQQPPPHSYQPGYHSPHSPYGASSNSEACPPPPHSYASNNSETYPPPPPAHSYEYPSPQHSSSYYAHPPPMHHYPEGVE